VFSSECIKGVLIGHDEERKKQKKKKDNSIVAGNEPEDNKQREKEILNRVRPF
jgi:hypothetical protein